MSDGLRPVRVRWRFTWGSLIHESNCLLEDGYSTEADLPVMIALTLHREIPADEVAIVDVTPLPDAV